MIEGTPPRPYQLDQHRCDFVANALAAAAPYAHPLLISCVAALIAGSSCSDALLILADAIDEAQRLAVLRDGVRSLEGRSLQVLSEALRSEAPAHAANDLFPTKPKERA